MRPLPRIVTAAVASTALVAAGALTTVPALAASDSLVVNEVYGGGGNSGATLTNDFIELQNRGTAAVALDEWSVQYHSSSATGSWQATKLTGTIQPGAYYVIQEAKGAGGTVALTPDATGTIAMSATAGTVALVHSTSALTCSDSAACAA
ncbi:MAG: lamin tail domain-containing protein, partial [Gordonia polyisoprenivorans]|nr:lamin tail domain-containing protein [Gordonia polyisoprenivorans]